MSFKIKLAGVVSGAAILVSAAAAQAEVLFWSTQAKPVEEAQAILTNAQDFIVNLWNNLKG